ncbi:hypothetical protein DWU98_10245 [Dyella monticola]|uniref:Uncharacterized protein n=2 Tax=Dyella monticola TaxID=1927958 RepID=A0A370WZS4_9GAMM|nr:hypothetical protein DWU98_10245 [Dyella monticola]
MPDWTIKSTAAFAAHLISIGVARFESCKYQGSFSGGAGFDCTIKNISSDEPRAVGQASCGGFDNNDRLIHSVDQVLDLYGAEMQPGEERVVRVYAPESSSTVVCAENGDLGSPRQLAGMMADLRKGNLVSDINI